MVSTYLILYTSHLICSPKMISLTHDVSSTICNPLVSNSLALEWIIPLSFRCKSSSVSLPGCSIGISKSTCLKIDASPYPPTPHCQLTIRLCISCFRDCCCNHILSCSRQITLVQSQIPNSSSAPQPIKQKISSIFLSQHHLNFSIHFSAFLLFWFGHYCLLSKWMHTIF